MSQTIVLERHIAAPPARVYEYLTDTEKWVLWQGVASRLDPRPGGLFSVQMPNGATARGEFVELVPDQRVVFTWGWIDHPGVPPGSSTVTIDLVARGFGTLVRLTHEGLPDEEIPLHVEGWEHYLPRLLTVSEGGDPGLDTA